MTSRHDGERALPPVDHVVIAGSDLERLANAFDAVGLDPQYGGVHSNGITHNYTLGFDDGSYVELISTLEPGQSSPWWDDAIHGDAGPCAWALPVEDIEAETERIADLGWTVDGPSHYSRERPDGTRIEWDLTVVGERELGETVPFLVSDRTPRADRVTASDALAGTELTGITEVVIGVPELTEALDSFRSFFDCEPPKRGEYDGFGVSLARFADAPVTLAAPRGEESWLTERLDRFGPMVWAYLLESEDVDESAERFDLSASEPWFDDELRWFDLGGMEDDADRSAGGVDAEEDNVDTARWVGVVG